MKSHSPQFSFCIPVRNDPENLRACLDGLARQDLGDCEVLVCDDGSDPQVDPRALSGSGIDVVVIRQRGSGPSVARNRLAQIARGEFLFFVDADTVPAPDMLERARRIVAEHPAIAAFFGSYDDDPEHRTLISAYRNLLHHFTHQQSGGREVETFWCGCGAIRRELYMAEGGLSPLYDRPSIEDIELGARISSKGNLIRIFPELQVKHRKLWTLRSWLYTDLVCRGIPWVRLMRTRNSWTSQLNFSWTQRVATAAAVLLLVSLPMAVLFPPLAIGSGVALCAFVGLNWRLLSLIRNRCGWIAAAATVPLHIAYSTVCVVSLVVGILLPTIEMPPVRRLKSLTRAQVGIRQNP